MVVEAGDAVIESPSTLMFVSPVVGDQEYETPPVATIVALFPKQMVLGAIAIVALGTGRTVTETVEESEHPLKPVTEYVVVAAGVAVTFVPVGELRLPAGDQVYVVAPNPVRVEDCPRQIVTGEAEAVTTGGAFTVTVTVVVSEHPFPSTPVNEYVEVEAGMHITLLAVPLLNPVVGDQV